MPRLHFEHPPQHSLEHVAPVAAWREGEILTVQIVAVNADGSYDVDTIETYAPDLKAQHAAELQALADAHKTQLEQLTESADLAQEMEGHRARAAARAERLRRE